MTVEEKGGEMEPKPPLSVEVDHYSDDQVAEWDRADRLADGDRERIVKAANLSNRRNIAGR